jgi:hypothetical protein
MGIVEKYFARKYSISFYEQELCLAFLEESEIIKL